MNSYNYVTNLIIFSVDELKRKWRGLRDTYGKELKKINKKSSQSAATEPVAKWVFFKNLQFLQGTMFRRNLKGNVFDKVDNSDEDDYANESQSSCFTPSSSPVQTSELIVAQTRKSTRQFKSPLRQTIKRRQSDDIDNRLLESEEDPLKCFKGNANNSDAQFLMSLLPFLEDIPKHRKLMVRTKIQQVLIDEQIDAS